MTPQELVNKLAANASESSQQSALFAWTALPEIRAKYPELKWMFAIPNGGLRFNPGRFKAEGVKSGVADIFLPVPKLGWHGLFIEMKKLKGGVVSEEQNEFRKFVEIEGYGWTVAHGFEQAKEVIVNYLTNGSVL